MFVFSTDQIRQLLNITYFASGSTLVDLGAGDGATTEKYMPLVQHVYTTEKSGPMIKILAKKGFRWVVAGIFSGSICNAPRSVARGQWSGSGRAMAPVAW